MTGGLNLSQDVLVLASQVLAVGGLESLNIGGLDLVEVSLDTGEEDAGLLHDLHWHVLLLLEELSELLTTVEQLLGNSVEIGTELGESGDLTVLSELELEGTGDLLHGLDLSGSSDTGHGKTDIDSWADTLVEKLSLQEDLTVGNGDDVGWDIGRHITSLGLNNWQGSQGSTTVLLVHLSCALEETRMKIEDITWESLTTGWASQEEGHLTVSDSLLGEIVVDDEGVLAVVTEVLANSATRVWGQELEWSGLRSGSGNDDGVLESIAVAEETHDVGNGGALLTNSNVDAVKRLGVVTLLVDILLVEDSVDGDGGLASLSVANNKLTLASANRDLK